MRKNIVAGNWKMNTDVTEATNLVTNIIDNLSDNDTEVIVAPPYVNLVNVADAAKDSRVIVAAQNMHQALSGAYTGEVSGGMLKNIGVQTVILGHSERRAYFNETDELLKEKVDSALTQGFQVIFCFGEELKERKSESHFAIVENQVKNALFHLDKGSFKNIVLAYEPVWAIGTGETASPEQAQEMHHFVRNIVKEHYDETTADTVSILYGGSVKPSNAKELFANSDVDGGLIGGAALKAEDFLAIVDSF